MKYSDKVKIKRAEEEFNDEMREFFKLCDVCSTRDLSPTIEQWNALTMNIRKMNKLLSRINDTNVG